ncbi:hypothetical protein [Roseomonas sp. BN140053]|uniref:hypothetical protein n=1 Tax=Roseomonas sp. BN140053 TaxID=3391898 RepID=UPI0039E9AEAA
MPRIPLLGACALLLLPAAAGAQSWPNSVGIQGDVIAGAVAPFDRLYAAQPREVAAAPGRAAIGPGRAPVPILDWTPPPPVTAAPIPAPRRAPARRAVRRAPAATPVAAPAANTQWLERRLADRERQLEQLRQQVEQDRQTLRGQNTGATVAPAPASPAPAAALPSPAVPAPVAPRVAPPTAPFTPIPTR